VDTGELQKNLVAYVQRFRDVRPSQSLEVGR
jgi:hypothetical protein